MDYIFNLVENLVVQKKKGYDVWQHSLYEWGEEAR